MVFTWVLKRLYSSSINPVSTGFVNASFTKTSKIYDAATKIFSRNSSEACVFDGGLNSGIIIKFKNPITITKYLLQTTKSRRYPTGWKVLGSYDGTSYMTIDEKEEDFCFEKYLHESFVDCGALTTRNFTIPPTTVKNLQILITKQDSCGSYRTEFTCFDVFGASPNHDFYCISHITQRIAHRSSILLFIITHIYNN